MTSAKNIFRGKLTEIADVNNFYINKQTTKQSKILLCKNLGRKLFSLNGINKDFNQGVIFLKKSSPFSVV